MLQTNDTTVSDLSQWPIACSFEEYECDRLGTLMRATKEFGTIFRCGKQMIFVNDPALIERVLVNTNQQFLVPAVPFRPDLGEDRIADWMAKRHGTARGLHHEQVFTAINQAVTIIEDQVSRWHDGQQLHLDEEMKQMSYRIVAAYFYGQDGEQLVTPSRDFVDAVVKFIDSPFAFPDWFPQPKRSRMRTQLVRFDRAIAELMQKRQATPSERSDLLTVLMQTHDTQGKALPEQAMREILIAMTFPSSSIAAALSWIWLLLMQHQEVTQALLQEIRDIPGDGCLERGDLSQLTYHTCVIKEALRLYPPTWLIERNIDDSCEINGYLFAKGQKVFMSPFVTQHNPQFFSDPDRFIPERWLDKENIALLPKYSYFPFGGGPRICTGATFAMTVLLIAMTSIVRHYTFHPLENIAKVRPNPQPFLIPEPSLRVIVKKRASAA